MQFNGLIDIGVNLTHARFDADRDAVLERAAAAGVTDMIVTGVDVAGSEAAAALAAAHPTILHATAGVHPHHAAQWSPDTAAALSALIERPSTVAMGETGLDYNRDFSPRADQRTAFAAQLRLAADHGHPVFLHQRDAAADFLAILREHRDALPDAVLHCFTGDQAMVEARYSGKPHGGAEELFLRTGGDTEDGVAVHVTDTGPGIPPDERDTAFERGHSTNDGTGLGLPIVRAVAEAHGWTVDVREAAAGGARFEFVGVDRPVNV